VKTLYRKIPLVILGTFADARGKQKNDDINGIADENTVCVTRGEGEQFAKEMEASYIEVSSHSPVTSSIHSVISHILWFVCRLSRFSLCLEQNKELTQHPIQLNRMGVAEEIVQMESPSSSYMVHLGSKCGFCKMTPIIGDMHTCSTCTTGGPQNVGRPSYQLCRFCYPNRSLVHPPSHTFKRATHFFDKFHHLRKSGGDEPLGGSPSTAQNTVLQQSPQGTSAALRNPASKKRIIDKC